MPGSGDGQSALEKLSDRSTEWLQQRRVTISDELGRLAGSGTARETHLAQEMMVIGEQLVYRSVDRPDSEGAPTIDMSQFEAALSAVEG